MPSEILTLEELRSLGVGIGLSDDALDIALTSEDEWLRFKAGPHATIEPFNHINVITNAYDYRAYLARPAQQILTIRQELWLNTLVIPDSEYELQNDNQTILFGPTIWPDLELHIDYRPLPDTGKRKMALVELVKNTLAYTGYHAVEVPGADLEWMACRQRILRQFDYRIGIA